MKVLYVVSLFPCWSETFIVREILALKRKGVEVIIFSLKQTEETIIQTEVNQLADSVMYPVGWVTSVKNNILYSIKSMGTVAKVYFDIVTTMYRTPAVALKSMVAVWRTLGVLPEIDNQNVDWIHAHWATYPSTSAMVISKVTNIPFSFTAHAHDIFEENQLLNQKYNAVSFGVTISEYNKKYLSSKLNRSFGSELNTIHCGVDLSEMKYSRQGRHVHDILTVGRLDEIKGFKYLIEACSLLKAENVNFTCHIVGEGPLKEELLTLRNQLGLQQQVEFLGVLKQEEVKKLLKKATMFVLPSVKTSTGNMDGIPVALMEAMAIGIPVISTNVSGIPELIEDGVNGYLCEPKNVKDLAKKITLLLADTELQNTFAKEARGKVESQFSAEMEAEKLMQLFIKGAKNRG